MRKTVGDIAQRAYLPPEDRDVVLAALPAIAQRFA
jgi:hypothetical protein